MHMGVRDVTMSKYISIPDNLADYLDKESPKSEDGKREETYSQTIERLLKKYKENKEIR